MNYLLAKRLIEDGILDFDKLVFRQYKSISLSEIEAFILIELWHQKQQGNTFLNSAKIGKTVTIPKEELLTILAELMKKELLTIQIRKTKSGKETEAFSLDNALEKLLAAYEDEIRDEIINRPKKFSSSADEIVGLIETHFQKQLTPLEIEIIQKWLDEDHFELLDIKKALLDAVKANKHSLSYVDGILVKRRAKAKPTDATTYNHEKSEALKTFFDSLDSK
ncbi:MAG: DnaD domain protein [Candidatus Izemoplasmatales bacterium]|nr:DnaD domain protein [Candidatus Izemoplasmatales bacterium]